MSTLHFTYQRCSMSTATLRLVSTKVCQHFILSGLQYVNVSFYQCCSMSTLRFVSAAVCQHFILHISAAVCQHFVSSALKYVNTSFCQGCSMSKLFISFEIIHGQPTKRFSRLVCMIIDFFTV